MGKMPEAQNFLIPPRIFEPCRFRHAHGENNDQAAQTARCVCGVGCTQTLGDVMRMAKTDQAALMHSSCCRNASAQPYRGTHIYAGINVYHLTMRSLNGAYWFTLLSARGVIVLVHGFISVPMS